ncbi:MAG: MFS transporter [Pseudomonadota bacterium]
MKNPQSSMEGLPKPRRYFAIFAISCGTAVTVIDGHIPNVALPTIAIELGIPASAAVLIVSVYQLVLVMSLLPFSALGNRIGLKRMYQLGQLLFLVSAVLCYLAPTLELLLAARTAQSLGAAAALSVASALVRATYPGKQLGRGLGVSSIIVSSSAAIAPVLGGYIVAVAHWQWIFVATAPLCLLSLIVGQHALPDNAPHKEPFSAVGAVLCAMTFGLLISGLLGVSQGASTDIVLVTIVVGLIISVAYIRRERSEALPILPIDLLANRVVALSIAGAQFAFIGSMTFILSLPFRLQTQYGFSPSEVGAVIVPWPLAMMVTAPIAGILSDRYHPGVLGGIGMAIATTGMLLLYHMPIDAGHTAIMWRMAMCGTGFGIFLAPNVRVVLSAAPLHRAASAGGLVSTNRLVGQTLGAVLLAGLLSVGQGSNSTPALIAAALTILAMICSLARLRYR